jgi:ubiquinone/menaquinone biosynthesis C-methylase UbiE
VKFLVTHKFTSYLTEYYSENKKFGLDIGCKNRPYHDLFQCKYVGIDIPSEKIHNKNIFPDIFSTGESLPFNDNTFDFITCYSVIPYVKNIDNLFDEMYRVIQPNGVIVIIIMNLRGLALQPKTHFENRFNSKQLHLELKKHNLISIKHNNPKTFFLSTYYDKTSVYAYAIVKPKNKF